MSFQVWSRFQATKSDGTLVKLRIQDLPEHRQDEAIELYLKYFVREELFMKAAGVPQNPKAMEEAREHLIESIKDPSFHNVICCVEKDDGEIGQIVGISLLQLIIAKSQQFLDIKAKTDEMRKLEILLNAVSEKYNPIEQLQLVRYYEDMGAVVDPQFRKLGIAKEFGKARRLACVAHNVPATGAFMTSVGIQKAAEKDDWENVLEIDLDDFGRQNGVTFEESGVRKYMIWKVPQFKDLK